MGDDEKSKKHEHKHLRPQWSGRDILDKEHAGDLDRESALHEFDGKLPRHEAEDKAYGDYKRQTHAKAAAHHLRGIKLAEATGDMREGRKHGLMYQLHCKQLGHEAIGPVPKEVQQHMDAANGDDQSKVYSFRAHKGDIFVLPDLNNNGNLGKHEEHNIMDNIEIDLDDEGLLLDWNRHDDNTGGYQEALDKNERVLYRTWAVHGGAKATKHVLVKHDGIRQTTLGYFGTREDAMAQAEGFSTLNKAERLDKEGQQLGLTGTNVAQGEPLGSAYQKAEHKAKLGTGTRFEHLKEKISREGSASDPAAVAAAIGRKKYGAKRMGEMSHHKADNEGLAAVRAAEEKGGKEASPGMGSSSASYGKGSKPWEGSGSESSTSTASSVGKGSKPWEGSSASGSSTSTASSMDKGSASASGSASHSGGGENAGLNRIKAAMRRAEGQTSGEMPNFSMSEKCAKCGSAANLCKCGNMGKAELCKRCGKAENLCKCSGMSKSEAQAKLAADEKTQHEAQYKLGQEVLAKVERTGTGELMFSGTDKDGNAHGVTPENLNERLHNLYVAARFVVEKAAAAVK